MMMMMMIRPTVIHHCTRRWPENKIGFLPTRGVKSPWRVEVYKLLFFFLNKRTDAVKDRTSSNKKIKRDVRSYYCRVNLSKQTH